MTTDKTPATLATVKHGGCVQLVTSERERFEAWLATQHDQGSEHVIAMVSDTDDRYQSPVTSSMWSAWQAANAAREGGRINGWRMYDGIRVYSASAHASIVDDQQFVRYDDYLAALSAQPSPGGQGPNEMADALERIAAGSLSDYEGVEADELHILRCAKLIRDLAARQPMGELHLPPDGFYKIVFDDAEVPDESFARSGALDAALRRFEQISNKWNAHLFVRFANNTRDCTVPNATPAQDVDLPYSLDADPAGIRARVCDVITGTLMVGAQGHTPPPAGHWAEPFWQAARADATAQAMDLGQFREPVEFFIAYTFPGTPSHAEGNRLLALIDGKAVGK